MLGNGLSGDDLAIFLFFASVGIAFVIPSVQGDGWKRWLFGAIGVLSFGCAFAWPWLKEVSPPAANAVYRLAKDPVAWLYAPTLASALWIAKRHGSQAASSKSSSGVSAQPEIARISDLATAPCPIVLRLQFHGGPTSPTAIRSDNVLNWYALWQVDATMHVTGADGRRETLLQIPRTWIIFLIFDVPCQYKQIAVQFNSPGGPGFEVKVCNRTFAIITSNEDIPSGILDINSIL